MTSIRTASLLFTALLASVAVEAQNLRTLAEPRQYGFSTGGKQDKDDTEVEGEENFIVGGSSVAPGTFPFFGHFLGNTLCSGVLIHEDIFLTAAHCLEDGFPATVRIGAVTTTSENEGQLVNVCSGAIHPDNNMRDMKNDLGILKLCDPVFVNSYARWNSNPGFPAATGQDLFIAGFGRTSTSSATSPILQTAKVDYLASDVCEDRYKKYDPAMNMCADAPNTGICYGDSGSPLMTEDNLVVGLASFIVDTCASEFPDFYTRLSTYNEWLQGMVCNLALNKPAYCSTPAPVAEPTDPFTSCLSLIFGIFSGFLNNFT